LSHLLTIAAIILAPGESLPPRFELQTAAGARINGHVEALGRDGKLTLPGQPAINYGDVVALRRVDVPLPPWPRKPHMVLANGDRIVGAPTELVGTFLHFQADRLEISSGKQDAKGLRFPVTWISLLWLKPPSSISAANREAIFKESRTSDEIVLGNGDVISGTLIGLDAKKGEAQIDLGTEKRSVPLDRVVAVAFNTRLARNRTPTGPYEHLVLTNGSRLTVRSPVIEAGFLTAQTLAKDTIRVALADVAALDVYQGGAVYLSDLKPSKYQYRTYQGEHYDWRADRNLGGQELQLSAKQGPAYFDKGLAVHGQCELTYELEGKFDRFECLVGLDAQLGQRGSAEIHVLVDGKERKIGDGKALTLEAGPWPLSLDVKGARQLTLSVHWGEGGNVGDFVNWCDARLILSSK